MRSVSKQDVPAKDYHISYSGDRIAMRHAPLPEAVLETLKQAVKIFSFTIRSTPHAELKCTFGELAAAARRVYAEDGDPRTAECLRALDIAHKLTMAADSTEPSAAVEKPKSGVVLVHPEHGVYLGNFLGLGFWSKLDPAGQEAAVVFPSVDEARRFAQSWDLADTPEADRQVYLDSLACVEVEIDSLDGEPFASVAACQKAGLDPWFNLDLMEPGSPTIH